MKQWPCQFKGPMVTAMLAGKKWITRRQAWQLYTGTNNPASAIERRGLRYTKTNWWKAKPGDQLWVREALLKSNGFAVYDANLQPAICCPGGIPIDEYTVWKWKPTRLQAMYMPREHSRLTWVLTEVRREPVQAITDADAIAEGFASAAAYGDWWRGNYGVIDWEDNPEVVVMVGHVYQCNIDSLPAMPGEKFNQLYWRGGPEPIAA